eukprot:TRINITY_DN39321_c0_g1_i1.p2 TRINITY_DN39321_c0_g1~~TRINITY_DN39321_c0_g1_i1.p2  ORF type:complete len:253 (+),score=99.37 TRINITY_DN39321_c0_g1_i1:64-759(+)
MAFRFAVRGAAAAAPRVAMCRMSAASLVRPSVAEGIARSRQLQQLADQRRFCATEAEAKKKESTEEAPEAEEGEEKDEKEKQIEELRNNLAYALAETDNVRKIARRDVDSARQYALRGFAKELLEVADNMERATASVGQADHSDPKVSALLDGIRLTAHSLSRAFEANGIKKMEVADGDEFDPDRHEALFNIPWSEGKTEGTVGQVVKSGYDYRGRVLRAAQCGVVAGKDE